MDLLSTDVCRVCSSRVQVHFAAVQSGYSLLACVDECMSFMQDCDEDDRGDRYVCACRSSAVCLSAARSSTLYHRCFTRVQLYELSNTTMSEINIINYIGIINNKKYSVRCKFLYFCLHNMILQYENNIEQSTSYKYHVRLVTRWTPRIMQGEMSTRGLFSPFQLINMVNDADSRMNLCRTPHHTANIGHIKPM